MNNRESKQPGADGQALFRAPHHNAEELTLTEGSLETGPDPQQETAADPEELAMVRRMMVTLAKAVKAVLFYPPENSICRQLTEDLASQTLRALRRCQTIRITMGHTKFFFMGEPVLEQPGRDESLPGHLYWSGMREICFHIGLTAEEISDLLMLLRESMKKTATRLDDVVTLMWDRKFDHITYIAVDDLLDLESEDDPIPEEFGTDYINFIDLEMHEMEDEKETVRRAKEMSDKIRCRINENDVGLFSISDEDRSALLGELQKEESPQMILDGAVRILVETLFAEEEEDAFIRLTNILGRTLVGRIYEGRLREASGLISVFRELRDGRDNLTPTIKATIDSTLSATWNPTQCEILSFHLDSGEVKPLNDLDEFLMALPPDALPAWCGILGSLETARARRRVIDALVRKAGDACEPFLPFLDDSRWYVVRNIALILGMIGNEKAIPALAKALEHEDSRVRREALDALNEISPERTVNILARSFTDADVRVRTTAARNAAMAGRKAVPHLLAVLKGKDFQKRELEEKRAFFEAFGYAAGREAIPFLREVLNRRSLLRRSQLDELRSCACDALGWTEGGDAVDLLTIHLQDRSPFVQAAARTGLARVSAGQEREPFIREAA